ncbi:MAG: TIGR03617 family F420-dependent LLM class oxidoreductase, partial [Acidimicrobiia bacterium]|nr:TIGR03617 family F420-dependent LLM class oxidoreductase [Acidimicrobiia bacterium]
VAGVPDTARQVEDLGFDGLVLTETKEDPYVVMAMAAATTSRIELTTAVAMAFPRSPTITAMTAWTLQRGSGGRFVLGLGTQVKGHVERRYGMKWSAPAPWIEEYIGAVRAVWDCWQNRTELDFHGEHYELTLMNPLFDPGPIDQPEIPIHLAAVNAGMARVAGRTADGLRPHPICTRRYLEEVLAPALETGKTQAGRTDAAIDVCASPLIVTGPDEGAVERRMSDVRARIAFYASTRTYRPVFDTHDWGDIAERLSTLSKQQRWDEMEPLVTDEMVDTIAVVAPYDRLAAAVVNRYRGVCSKVEFSIPVTDADDAERLSAMVGQIQEASERSDSDDVAAVR